MLDSPTARTRQTPASTTAVAGVSTPDAKRTIPSVSSSSSLSSSSLPFVTRRRSMTLAYCFTFAFFVFTIFFLLFSTTSSNYQSSVWFTNIINTRSRFSTIFSHFFPNPTTHSSPPNSVRKSHLFRFPVSREINSSFDGKNETTTPSPGDFNGTKKGVSENSSDTFSPENNWVSEKPNGSLDGKVETLSSVDLNKGFSENSPVAFSPDKYGFSGKTDSSSNGSNEPSSSGNKTGSYENQMPGLNGPAKGQPNMNETSSSDSVESAGNNEIARANSSSESVKTISSKGVVDRNITTGNSLENDTRKGEGKDMIMVPDNAALSRDCDFFDGTWVKDYSYPLYEAGSCPHIDEPFDCLHNGRPERAYENYRWQPKGCNIPRLKGGDFLELLRGKRLVYVGDSLNRNMWESMVCALRNSVKDKSKVFEASGRLEFRSEGSYSFLFADYNCSLEFFRSAFLVQEWEMPDDNGSKKETLRIDLIESSSDRYKNADILVFNTGHWWTHEKTSEGKGYYQEGSHVYSELDVVEAFRKAMTTWARWIDANINPRKSTVFFRGYSTSHFGGGQWNSGGQCDNDTQPITDEKYLSEYPPIPIVDMLEKVLKEMKTPVFYLNVTKMTDFRRDAHPSIYRKQNLSKEEMQSILIQDCSHWCLPGVPDTWNEILYAHLLTKYNQNQNQNQNQGKKYRKKTIGKQKIGKRTAGKKKKTTEKRP